MIGKTISYYKILEKLGEGGIGPGYTIRAISTAIGKQIPGISSERN